jgi:hypothetical protein
LDYQIAEGAVGMRAIWYDVERFAVGLLPAHPAPTWFVVAWLVAGAIAALFCFGTAMACFGGGNGGMGLLFLLLTPVAFVLGGFAVFVALLLGVFALVIGALA